MDFPIQLRQQGWDCPLYILRGHRFEFPNYDASLSLSIGFTLKNSLDPDETQHYTAFHLSIHCLPRYMIRGFIYTKGSNNAYSFFNAYSNNQHFIFCSFHAVVRL